MDSKETCSTGLFGKSASFVGDNESISARGSPGAGVSMESYLHNFHQQQHNNKGIMSCPPVAMSLRTRETSSMALKHIFDQQIINGASSREQEYMSGGFQGMRNQSVPDLRKRIPDLDLTFRKAQENNPSYAQTGFGSPISTLTHQSSLSQAPLPPMNGQLMQQNYLPQAAASTRLNPSSRQSTAQMTIFYSGNVNVYDDVPADKAHAIMLLAGNSWSSSFRCPPPPSAAPVLPPETTMMTRERPPSPAKATPSQHAPAVSTNNTGGAIAKNFASPAPAVAAASLASPPPSPAVQAPAPPADTVKSSQAGTAAKRPNAGIELPHARKASLARFLEKRKDRVQVQQQDQQGGAAAEKGEGESASCNDKPEQGGAAATSLSSKRPCTQLPSPSRSNSNVNNTNNNATDEILIINEHCFFH